MKPIIANACALHILFGFGMFATTPAAAHCDTLDGPVVAAARKALNSGDVTPVLKWVRAEHETMVRDTFARTLKVRVQSPMARELADTYFFETLVRIHRSGEGEPYTGLKPSAEVEPGIAAADSALESGKVDGLADGLSSEMSAALRQRFARLQQAQGRAEENVAAGRAYVEAYVQFIHYVENLHEAIAAADKHGASAAAQARKE